MNINIREFVSSVNNLRNNKISIEKLNKIGVYEDKYRHAISNTSPLDREKVTNIINKTYAFVKKSPPPIYFVDSPTEADKLYKKLTDGRLTNDIGFISTLDTFEKTAVYDFFENEAGDELESLGMSVLREFTLNLHKVIALDNEAEIIIERPNIFSVDNNFHFHNLTGPAISYRDGNDFEYYIHGISVESKFIKDQEKITFDEIISFKNKLSLLNKDDIEDETVKWLINNFGEIFNEFH